MGYTRLIENEQCEKIRSRRSDKSMNKTCQFGKSVANRRLVMIGHPKQGPLLIETEYQLTH